MSVTALLNTAVLMGVDVGPIGLDGLRSRKSDRAKDEKQVIQLTADDPEAEAERHDRRQRGASRVSSVRG
jgi:hypothetical protein